MKQITLKNFKSYDSQLIHDLNPRINLFIGKNGDGKSNFFKALIFALTDKVHLNRNQYNSHLHRALDNIPHPIMVEIYFRNKTAQKQYDQDLFKIERIWHSETEEEFKIEEKSLSISQYQDFIESIGFSYSNAFNILQQGKITQVTQMNEFEIYKLLEDATSIKKIERKTQEALSTLAKNEEQKKEYNEWLKQIQVRLELYSSRKEEFDMYSFEEKAKKVHNKGQYENMLKKFKRDAKILSEKQVETQVKINEMKLKIKQMQRQLEQVDSEIKVNQKQMYEHFDDSTIDDLDMTVNLSQQERSLASKMKRIKPQKEKMKNKLQKIAKETQLLTTQLKPYKQKYEYMNSMLTAEKYSKQNKDKAKDDLKTEIKTKQQHLKQIQSQLKKIKAVKSDFKIQQSEKESKQLSMKKEQLESINNQLKLNKVKYFVSSRQKNKYESEVEVYQQQIEVNYGRMRKALPLLEFNLLNQLRKQKIPGVFGFMIQFLEIDPSVLFAYEMANLSKLCTLLVEDEKTCEAVIRVNQKIKGKQINIMPLSFVDRQPAVKKPKPTNVDDCYSLINEEWIKIRPHKFGDKFTKSVQKIINSTFNSHVLVKDYDLGLKVSRQYFLNCITADKEVVYSEGYLCKVGKDTNVDDKLQLFYKYAEKNHLMQNISQKLRVIAKQVNDLQNAELELSKKKMITETAVKNLESKLSVISEQKKSLERLQASEKQLTEKKEKYQNDLTAKKDILKNFDKRNNVAVNMQQYTEVKQQYDNKLKSYNKNIELESQLERELQKLAKQQEQINEKIHNVSIEMSFVKDNNVSFVGAKQYKEQLQKNHRQLERKKRELQQKIRKQEQKVATAQTQNYNHLGNIAIIEDQIQFYADKLKQLGELDTTAEEIAQQSNSFSMSMNRTDKKKKVRIFTAYEKLTFGKLEGWLEKYNRCKCQLKQMEQLQKQVYDFTVQLQKEKDRSILQIFQVFQKNFDHIFSAITLHGKSDVRFKKVNEIYRGISRVRNSISIMVSFDSNQDTTRKWHEFSGGQKTVIAVCILMALQKCQPAPLYVLDEIDAALDPVYLDRIVKLISQESQRSQYFITSFKRGMLSFPEEICNYYLVENYNRVSSIRRLGLKSAQQYLDRIVES